MHLEAWPEPPQTSKMQSFAIIINGFSMLTFVAKLSVLYFCGVLATPLAFRIISERKKNTGAYLKHSQRSATEHFCENS